MSTAIVRKTSNGFEVTQLPDPWGRPKAMFMGAGIIFAALVIILSNQSSRVSVVVAVIMLFAGLFFLVLGMRMQEPQPMRTLFDNSARRITSADVKGPDDAPLDVAFEDVAELVVSYSKLEGEKTTDIIMELKDGTEISLASHEGEETSLIAELIRCRLEAGLPGPIVDKNRGHKKWLHGMRYF